MDGNAMKSFHQELGQVLEMEAFFEGHAERSGTWEQDAPMRRWKVASASKISPGSIMGQEVAPPRTD